ncbi:MAG: chromate transporter [Acutalibacteraceae bacterium]
MDRMTGPRRAQLCGQLFLSFLQIGATTFGGGYAMIPLIQREAVEKKHWVTDEDVLDIVAIAESTPGPIAINAATFVGYHTAGFWGAACATFGVVLPSFLIILLISLFLRQFESLRLVQYAFVGIRAAVLALVLSAVWKLARQTRRTAFSLCVAATVFALAVFVPRLDVLWLIAASAAAGILLQAVRAGKERQRK